MAAIEFVEGREILDSRGNPTLEVHVRLSDGTEATASVPSGASTGAYEARELRDLDPNRYNGLGVINAVHNVHGALADAVKGMDADDQRAVDQKMLDTDGTENKSKFGANAILGISMALCRAAARSQKLPLYRHIEKIHGKKKKGGAFPVPMFNVLNGGKHSDSGFSVQEFKLVPAGIAGFPAQLRAGAEIFQALRKILAQAGFNVGVGDEGGFAPRLESHNQAFEFLSKAVADAHYKFGTEVFLGVDVAANSFYDEGDGQYHLRPENKSLTKESLTNMYREWIQKYSVVSIEDGLNEEDWGGWAMMQEKLVKEKAAWSEPLMLIGDDLLVTNVKRLEKAITEKACNAILIKLNQIGTVTETLDCIALAEKNGMRRVISHRSGETTDDFIADLAAGTGAPFIKAGSTCRGERVAKYNRLQKIYSELFPKEAV